MQEKIIIPERITNKINDITKHVGDLLSQTQSIQQTRLSQVQFRFNHSADRTLLSDFERAQSVCFVTRYETLPIMDGILVTQNEDRSFNFDNLSFMRHILNEFRPIIINQSDSVYFHNIHNFVRGKLINNDPSQGLDLSVFNEHGNNVTIEFTRILDERIKSVRFLIDNCEIKYIYNGILQHSEHKYTDRFWDEYYSGEIYS
jgi:hypothetical protein